MYCLVSDVSSNIILTEQLHEFRDVMKLIVCFLGHIDKTINCPITINKKNVCDLPMTSPEKVRKPSPCLKK